MKRQASEDKAFPCLYTDLKATFTGVWLPAFSFQVPPTCSLFPQTFVVFFFLQILILSLSSLIFTSLFFKFPKFGSGE